MSNNKNKSSSKMWQLELANKNMELEISARKQIERSLKDKEDRFRTIFSHAPVTYFLCNLSGDFLDGNLEAINLTGYKQDELFGKNFIDLKLIDKKDQKMILEIISRCGKGENTGPDEFSITKKDGSKAIIEMSTSPVTIHEQKQILGIARDITNRKLAQLRLSESEKRYKKLFNSSKDALMTLHPPTWKFTSGNPAILDMFKVKSIKEYLKCGPWDISPEKQPDGRLSSDKAKEMIETAMTKGSNFFNWTHKRLNGESFPATVLLTKIQLQDETFLQATVRDITEQKEAEVALQRSEIKYRDLFEKSDDAVLIIQNEKFVDCNQATINMLRYKNKEDFLNTHPSELSPEIQPDGKKSFTKADEMMKIALTNGSHRFEWDHKKSDGEVFPVEVLLTAISSDEKNQILHVVWRDITERKQAEEGMARLSRIFEDSLNEIYLFKADTIKFVQVNMAAQQNLGYTMEELENLTPIDIKPKITSKLFTKLIAPLRNGEQKKIVFQTVHKRKDQTLYDVEVHLQLLHYESEELFVAIINDITNRKQAEEALKKNEEKYRSLTENLPLGIYRNTPGAKGKFLEVNKALINMFGFKDRESMLATNTSSLYVSPSTRKTFSDKLKKEGYIKNEELRLLRQDGSTFIGSSTAIAVKDNRGKVIHYDGIIEDITERAELSIKLLENEEKFRSIVSNSPCVIMQTDRQGVISFINYKYSEQEPENIVGKAIYDFMPHEFHEVAKNTIKKVFETGESFSFENLGFSSDESVVWYKNTVSSIQKNDKVVGVAILAADISEQKQTDIMKTEFISSVSHELRTPLTIIRESLSLLSDELYGKLNKDQADIVNPCIEDVDRLGRIINNLLDISRMEGQKIKIEREIVDIVKLAQGVVSSFNNKAASKNIKLIFKSNRESIDLYLDNDRIIQVFMNLIGNAIKFTEEGKIEIIITEKKDNVECSISDTGRGINPKDIGTIFDRFHQVGKVMRAGERGSGLGLSISKGIIKLHKGKIWVDSNKKDGSKFCFALPMYSMDNIIIENIDDKINKVADKHIKLSLLLIKLNNISNIESKFGVEKANKVTKLILQIIQDKLAPGEFSFIKEKDEVILFSDITKQNIIILFSKLEDMLAKSVLKIDKDLTADLSYGYSLYPNDGGNAGALIQNAFKTLLNTTKI